MTYPLIGNYGVDPMAVESDEIQPSGFVVREACATPSHPRSAMALSTFLQKHRTPGLEEADTRMLTTKIRSRGTMKAAIVPAGSDLEEAARDVRSMPHPDTRNLVAEVSCRKPLEYPGPADRT